MKRAPQNQYVWPAFALAAIIAISLAVANISWPSGDGATTTGSQSGSAVTAPAQRSYAPSVNRAEASEAAIGARANLSLLAKELRYYDAKTARLEAQDAAAGALYVPFVAAAYYEPSTGVIDVDQYLTELNTGTTTGGFNLEPAK
jgi:hypothetical protein